MIKRLSKRALLITAICLAIALLTGLTFLPSVKKRDVAAGTAVEYDGDGITKLNACAAYTAGRGFSTSMTGKIAARALGVKYAQNVSGGRAVDGDAFTDTTQSVSPLVKFALKREYRDGEYKIYHGKYQDKEKTFVYRDGKTIARQEYIGLYGKPNTGLIKYNVDYAVMGVKRVADNAYRYTLDPVRATAYCKNEIKTALGGRSYPYYSSVEFTLVFDGDRPVKVTATEKFRVDKFGGADCTAEYTETFTFN